MKEPITTDILNACIDFHKGRGSTLDLALADKYPPKVVIARMEKMHRTGYIESGVSTRTAWITEKGLEYLGKVDFS